MNPNTPLLTDLYQLTMAAGYRKCGNAEHLSGGLVRASHCLSKEKIHRD